MKTNTLEAPAPTNTPSKPELTAEEKTERIGNLLTQLNAIPKGERASKEAKKIRRQLRNLGHWISKQAK